MGYTYTNAIIYTATCVSAVLLWRREWLVAVVHAVLLGVVVARAWVAVGRAGVFAALCFASVLTLVSYLCVAQFGMWRHAGATMAIPAWMPFTWALVGFFAIDMYRYLCGEAQASNIHSHSV